MASLIDTLAFQVPNAIQTSLVASAWFARFDLTGRFVATARGDFVAVIWDLDTMAEVRTLEGHVAPITTIDWSRNSRYVLTASKDWNCIVWDLAGDLEPIQRMRTIRFDVPVTHASFHPRNSNIILVVLITGEAFVVDVRPGKKYREELCGIACESDEDAETRVVFTCAEFDPTGRFIFAGTSSSYVFVFNTRSKKMIARHKISGAGTIKQIKLSRSGSHILTNSSDRVIRHSVVPDYNPASADSETTLDDRYKELESTYKFSDPVDKVSWRGIGYSADGEWVIGGAADAAKHRIYLWDLSQAGALRETLEGGREPLVDVQWHPRKPMMASTNIDGNILLWHCRMTEKWGAFAGDFEELDENVEYVEREDEFDIEDEQDIIARKLRGEEEDVDIDTTDDKGSPPTELRSVVENGWEEDIRWAEEHPDNDTNWTLRIIMRDED